MKTEIETLVNSAQDIINKLGDGQNHTVGTAVLTDDGIIVTAVNLGHFICGPHSEVAVISKAFSEGYSDLKMIVAVGDQDRGVVSPCGGCRQFIFDYYPEMKVIVNNNGENIVVPIKELLPHTFDYWAQ
jgi:cytidine deaminase